MRDQYIQNPCETMATAYWKDAHFKKPEGIAITLENNNHLRDNVSASGTRYFRLMHDMAQVRASLLPEGYSFRAADLPKDAACIADIINRCYDGYAQTEASVLSWTHYPVFNNDLWVFVWDTVHDVPAALGIADFDADIKEGSLEWIQVLLDYRGHGLGEAVVLELLNRLASCADFVTVSGEVDNHTSPERLYRKCGFTGSAVWVVTR